MEDFSDAASLPHASIFKFTIISKSFFSKECREKVQKRIDENLVPTSNDKIKQLTREEIINYGKQKQIILDSAAQLALPDNDPRKNLSEVDQVARSAADKLFEMTCQVRRAKKDRITRLEEEAAAKATEEHPAQPVTVDDGQLDAMLHLVDYPQTREEALALSRHSQSLNGVFVVSQVPKSDADDEEEAIDEEDEDMGGSEGDDGDDHPDKEKESAAGEQEEKREQANTPDSTEEQAAM